MGVARQVKSDPMNESLFPELAGPEQASHTTGLLPSQHIEELIRGGVVVSDVAVTPEQIQPASMDLRLGSTAYRVRASFLPGKRSTVMSKVNELLMQELDLNRPTVLERGCVYIVPLMESLHLPPGVSAKANPKSTTGRLDVFTRLITDCGTSFEEVPPGYKGKLFVEVVPRTFSVRVRSGLRLNQVRFTKGTPPPSDRLLDELHESEVLLFDDEDQPADALISKGLWISIDLRGSGTSGLVGYRAKSHAPLVDFDCVGCYEPDEFWEQIPESKARQMILNPGDFYILGSKQRIRVPTSYAAAMVPYDSSVGEYRIHYAGFFDPGFGYGNNDIKGTRAVLEVRSHEVPFVLEEGQIVGRLIYERLLRPPSKVYGQDIGSSYQGQGLALSKQFKQPLQVLPVGK